MLPTEGRIRRVIRGEYDVCTMSYRGMYTCTKINKNKNCRTAYDPGDTE